MKARNDMAMWQHQLGPESLFLGPIHYLTSHLSRYYTFCAVCLDKVF